MGTRSKLILSTSSLNDADAVEAVSKGELFVVETTDADTARIETKDGTDTAVYRPDKYYQDRFSGYDEKILELKKKISPLSVSIWISGSSIFEVGTTHDVTVQWNIKQGDIPATGITSVTINGENMNASSPSGRKTYGNITGKTDFEINVRDSDGQTASKSVSVSFVYPSYFGVVSSLKNLDFASDNHITEADILSFGSKAAVGSRSWTVTVNGQNGDTRKNCYAYPKSFGALTKITDGVVMYLASYDKSEINVNNQPYFVYLLKDPSTVDDGYKLTFA